MDFFRLVAYTTPQQQEPGVMQFFFITSPLPLPRLGVSGLPLVLRALHKYHVAEKEREALDFSSVEERNACDAAQRLVSMLCERLCSAWGSSAVVSAANKLRYGHISDRRCTSLVLNNRRPAPRGELDQIHAQPTGLWCLCCVKGPW